MILHFGITTTATLFASARIPIPPTDGNAASCPLRSVHGKTFCQLGLFTTEKGQPDHRASFLRGKSAAPTTVGAFAREKRGKSLRLPF